MSKARKLPSLRRHKTHSQGIVRLNGNDVWLGSWPADQINPPPAVQTRYDQEIAEWLARGRQPRVQSIKVTTATKKNTAANSNHDNLEDGRLTISEMLVRFLEHARTYYRHANGDQTREYLWLIAALRPLNHLYGKTPAEDFKPGKLESVRELMRKGYKHPEYGEQEPLCRKNINQRISRIRRAFKWAVSKDLVSANVWHSLQALDPLKKGRCDAKEAKPIDPVAIEIVEQTLPHMTNHVRGAVRLQLLIGCRPAEALQITLAMIDRSGPIWVYRPKQHKTAHHGKSRIIAIGPKAQAVIREYVRIECPLCGEQGRPPRLGSPDGVLCGPCADQVEEQGITGDWQRREVHGEDEPLFSPKVAMMEWDEERRARRKTKVQPSQKNRKKVNPRKRRKDVYCVPAYDLAITSACKKAGVVHWHPNQLRHTHATEVRRLYGLEAAQVALGHSQANVTEIYAERDLTLASKVAAEIG